MPETGFLRGDHVTLYPPTDDDASFVAGALNHPGVWQSMDRVHPTTTGEQADRLADLRGDDDAFPFVVRADGDRVGFVRLRVLNAHWRNASLTYWIAPDAQGDGFGGDAVETVVAFGFDHLALHKLLAMTFESNEASQRLLESLGFSREAEFESEVYVDGAYEDLYGYGLLEPGWESTATESEPERETSAAESEPE